MREIQSKDVRTSEEELFNHLQTGRSWTQSDELLGRFAPALGYLGDSRDSRSFGCGLVDSPIGNESGRIQGSDGRPRRKGGPRSKGRNGDAAQRQIDGSKEDLHRG